MSREMKDCDIFEGVKIPANWDIMKFGKVCSIVTDFVASGSFADLRENVTYLSEPDYAMLVRTTDLAKTARSEGKVYISKASYEFLSNSNLFGGEIVLPNIGSIGDVYVVPKLYERMSLAPNSIMFKTHYCDKYYYYYFQSKVGGIQLSEISQSTAMAKFNKTDLKQIRVFLPSLEEQQKIASFLDRKCAEIDEMIALQEKIVEELKAYKQSVIAEAVTKGLNPNAPMKDSGIEWIGEIPSHWEILPHKRIMRKIKEIQEHYNGENIISLTMKGVIVRDLEAGGKMPATFDGYQRVYPNNLLQCLFDIDVTPRCVGLIKEYGLTSPAYSQFELFSNAYSPYYDYLLRYMDDIKAMLHLSKNLRSSLTEADFGAISTCVPPVCEQKIIAEYLDTKCTEIDNLISIKLSKIDSLKEYKKSIIYEYVTGKKEVTE